MLVSECIEVIRAPQTDNRLETERGANSGLEMTAREGETDKPRPKDTYLE